MKYVKPTTGTKSFTCPHCDVLARQYHWGYLSNINAGAIPTNHGDFTKTKIRFSQCEHCSKNSIWHNNILIYPNRGGALPPNPDMPEMVKADYEEAANIITSSPRGAAALLRLSIQKLCVHLEEPGKNINTDIKNLVKKGLPDQVRQALDVVRVTGNNAVHPGVMDVNDVTIASELFNLVNVITEYMVSLPSKVGILYDGLPKETKEAIEKRDNDT
ncbi:DUF4145 domain-containing protein [candidate division KSB1 bacterium]|nr:DUF4145 domain-containing protein [candidate division KSB1 bacterium]